MMKVLIQSNQVPLQHGNGHLANHRHVRHSRNLKQRLLVHVLEAGNIDHRRIGLDPVRGQPICLGRHASDHHRGLSNAGLWSFTFALVQPPAAEEIDGVDINGIDVRPIVCQHY